MKYALGTLAALLFVATSSMGMVAAPYARVFASSNGEIGLKIIPAKEGGGATAVLFSLNADGSEKESWRAPMENLPGDVLIYVWGGKTFIVTLDTWGMAGGGNALVIYDAQGKRIAAKSDRELSGDDAQNPGLIASDGVRWKEKAELVYDRQDPKVRLTLVGGKVVDVLLATGQIQPQGEGNGR